MGGFSGRQGERAKSEPKGERHGGGVFHRQGGAGQRVRGCCVRGLRRTDKERKSRGHGRAEGELPEYGKGLS